MGVIPVSRLANGCPYITSEAVTLIKSHYMVSHSVAAAF